MKSIPEPAVLPVMAVNGSRVATRRFLIVAGVLTAMFVIPLGQLVSYAARTDLHSHILLVPFISAYFFKLVKQPTPNSPRPSPGPALLAGVLGIAALGLYFIYGVPGRLSLNDKLAAGTFAYLCLLFGAAAVLVGWTAMRPYAFAIFFLAFLVPLPDAVIQALSIGLQYVSAEASDIMIGLTGTPRLRDGLHFRLPGLTIFVAEECSGIRSTLVLFITSIIAGRLFLRRTWHRVVLAAVIFPLGVLRNGFRITTISWLTVNVDPEIINGPLHHRGGPIFFVLSLFPLFALVWWMRRSDSRRADITEK